MRTQKDREGYRLYRLAGGLLDMYDGAEELEKAKEAAREKACRGIDGKKEKKACGEAIERNLMESRKMDYGTLSRAYGLPVSEREFWRRKKIYATELVEKLGIVVGKKCDIL